MVVTLKLLLDLLLLTAAIGWKWQILGASVDVLICSGIASVILVFWRNSILFIEVLSMSLTLLAW